MITEKAVDKKGNRFLTVITEPTDYPVTVDEIKNFARIDGNDEDSILENFLAGVVENVEAYLGRALITRTYKLFLDEWNSKEIELPRPPLISVSSIVTIDEDDKETEYDSSKYYAVTSSIPGRVLIKQGYATPLNTERKASGYAITYNAGYGEASDIPYEIKVGIMQWVTMIYENRSMTENDFDKNGKLTGKQVPNEVQKGLRAFRVIRI
jgi:uncharacterized phiE125 gp8 family phage protein